MIDYYDLMETAVVELVRSQLAAYFTDPEKSVTKSDDTHLDQGHDYFCFVYPGVFPAEIFGNQIVTVNWEVILDVFARYNSTEKQAWIDMKKIRAELFWLFNLREIGRTINKHQFVDRVVLSAEDRPRYIPVDVDNPDSGIAFIGQVMVLTVTQRINKS